MPRIVVEVETGTHTAAAKSSGALHCRIMAESSSTTACPNSDSRSATAPCNIRGGAVSRSKGSPQQDLSLSLLVASSRRYRAAASQPTAWAPPRSTATSLLARCSVSSGLGTSGTPAANSASRSNTARRSVTTSSNMPPSAVASPRAASKVTRETAAGCLVDLRTQCKLSGRILQRPARRALECFQHAGQARRRTGLARSTGQRLGIELEIRGLGGRLGHGETAGLGWAVGPTFRGDIVLIALGAMNCSALRRQPRRPPPSRALKSPRLPMLRNRCIVRDRHDLTSASAGKKSEGPSCEAAYRC